MKPVSIKHEDGRKMELLPTNDNGFFVNFKIDYPHVPAIGQQQAFYLNDYGADLAIDPGIASARAFDNYGGLLKNLKFLRYVGLKKAYDRVWDYGIHCDDESLEPLNTELRFKNEFAMHKVLDAVGDLHLAGYPMIGMANCYKTSHATTHEVLKKLFSDENNYCFGHLKIKGQRSTEFVAES
jgi:UDP-3-O-[3-hydroxymyristoyl] N-acetylglucosamine deacetylase